MLFGEAGEQALKFGLDNVDANAALLADGVVVMGCKDLAELDLAFKTVPNAVNNAEFFKQFHSAVYRGAVQMGLAMLGQASGCDGANLGQLFKYHLSSSRKAAVRAFERLFKSRNHRYSICDIVAKMLATRVRRSYSVFYNGKTLPVAYTKNINNLTR